MAVYASAGTCLSVSAAAPATHDTAGFAALTWTTVGELETVGDLGTSHAAVTFANLCTGKTDTLKGAEEPTQIEIMTALDRDDAGQALMTTARQSLTAIYSFRVTEGNGDVVYFRAYVMSDRVVYGGINDPKKGVYNLGVKTPASGQTFVQVNAA